MTGEVDIFPQELYDQILALERRNCYLRGGPEAQARKLFADSRGWVERRCFTVASLIRGHYAAPRYNILDIESSYPRVPGATLFDHNYYFRQGRKPVAIVTHPYSYPTSEHTDWAREHGLQLEILPNSWYYPGVTTAVCVTRRAE
jgi:hypothetical protein